MSATDASSITVDAKPSATRTENIFTIPPAAELFADTYDHAIDKTVIYICILNPVHTASVSAFSVNADYITKALEDCGYNTNTQLKRKRFSTEKDLREFLNEVKTMDFYDCSAVLLYWFGETDKNGSNGMITLHGISFDIRDLWKPFLEVDDLIGKLKINMFFTYLPPPSSIATDSDVCNVKKSRDPYETPREADVLIIYQKTAMKRVQDGTSYVQAFANNMTKLGRQYHICNLASINTVTDPDNQQYPIVVSTLTRKFFLQAGQHRGIHFELDQLSQGIQLNLNIMLQGGNQQKHSTSSIIYINKWKKKLGRRQSANTVPSTPRRHSRETLLSDNALPQLARPPRAVANVTPVRQPRPVHPRPRLPSQSKSIEPKPKWIN